ncbi:MAG: YiiD C-terminal domain-containing protein [Parashewanella sp.]
MESKEQLLKNLKQQWYETIPLSAFMKVEPIRYDTDLLVVTAPIEPNINCHNTMFAGSISTLATLTGWGMFWLQQQLQQVQGSIVLANANIRYLAPITSRPLAKVSWPNNELTHLKQGKKQGVELNVEICCEEKVCALFTGKYVSLPKS